MPKCIARLDTGKRCTADAQTKGDWPQTSLCPGHWLALQNSDPKKGNGGKGFDTMYQYGDNPDVEKNFVGLCHDESRKNFPIGSANVSEYYFCDPGNTDRNKHLDECLTDVPGSPRSSPGSPRAFDSPRPGSPSRLAVTRAANLSPIAGVRGGLTFTCAKPTNRIDQFNKQLKDKKDATSYSVSKAEEEEVEESEVNYKPRWASRLTPLDAKKIETKEPEFDYKKEKGLLENIDRTRDVKEALEQIKILMNNFDNYQLPIPDGESDPDGESGPGVPANAKYTYIVSETIVNKVAKKLGKYMDNPDRIELVLTFLFDYESRDLFEQMKFYGFSYEGGRKPGTTVANLLIETPYSIRYALTSGSGNVSPDVARPREISNIFADKIKRINAANIPTPAPTDTGDRSAKVKSPSEQAAAAQAAAAQAAAAQAAAAQAAAAAAAASGRPINQRMGGNLLSRSEFFKLLDSDEVKNKTYKTKTLNSTGQDSLQAEIKKLWKDALATTGIDSSVLTRFINNIKTKTAQPEIDKEVDELIAYIKRITGAPAPASVPSGAPAPIPSVPASVPSGAPAPIPAPASTT
jgi:hypothetical protein